MGKKCKVKLDVGTVYQKEEGGTYYFHYQVQHERKCVSLKTSKSVCIPVATERLCADAEAKH